MPLESCLDRPCWSRSRLLRLLERQLLSASHVPACVARWNHRRNQRSGAASSSLATGDVPAGPIIAGSSAVASQHVHTSLRVAMSVRPARVAMHEVICSLTSARVLRQGCGGKAQATGHACEHGGRPRRLQFGGGMDPSYPDYTRFARVLLAMSAHWRADSALTIRSA